MDKIVQIDVALTNAKKALEFYWKEFDAWDRFSHKSFMAPIANFLSATSHSLPPDAKGNQVLWPGIIGNIDYEAYERYARHLYKHCDEDQREAVISFFSRCV